jgi:steroid 5-alpha reductase family enzyme
MTGAILLGPAVAATVMAVVMASLWLVQRRLHDAGVVDVSLHTLVPEVLT